MSESFLNSPLIYSIALTLIHFLWQGVLIALVLKTALLITPHYKSQLRYGLSSGAMILNLVSPIVTFFIIYQPNYFHLTHQLSKTAVNGSEQSTITSQQATWYANVVEYLPYLTIAWLCVIAVMSLKLIIELYTVNQLPKNNALAPDATLLARFQELSNQVGIKKTPTLLLSLNIKVPMAIGWIKPIVLLPVHMLTGLTPTQLDMLILHELAHIRRYDYAVNFVQSIVEIILFFHPCVLWISNQMRNEREYCSDDIAVKHCGDPIAYAHTLTDTASLCNKHRHHSIPTMAMAASGGDLTQRVLRLVQHHHCASSNQVSKWFASLTVLSVVLFMSSHQIVKLLKVELNAANYVPRVEIHNSPVLTAETEAFTETLAPTELTVPENEVTTSTANTQPKVNQSVPVEQPKSSATNEIASTNTTVPTITSVEETLAPQTASNIDSVEQKLTQIENTYRKEPENYNTASSAELSLDNPYSNALASLNVTPNNNEQRTFNDNTTKSNTFTPSTNNNPINPIESEQAQAAPVANTAELVFSVPPRYPSSAKRKGIELEVKVDFTIDANGNVKNIEFPEVKHQINYFKNAIRSAVERWRFIPATYDGKAIDSKMSKIFSFHLQK